MQSSKPISILRRSSVGDDIVVGSSSTSTSRSGKINSALSIFESNIDKNQKYSTTTNNKNVVSKTTNERNSKKVSSTLGDVNDINSSNNVTTSTNSPMNNSKSVTSKLPQQSSTSPSSRFGISSSKFNSNSSVKKRYKYQSYDDDDDQTECKNPEETNSNSNAKEQLPSDVSSSSSLGSTPVGGGTTRRTWKTTNSPNLKTTSIMSNVKLRDHSSFEKVSYDGSPKKASGNTDSNNNSSPRKVMTTKYQLREKETEGIIQPTTVSSPRIDKSTTTSTSPTKEWSPKFNRLERQKSSRSNNTNNTTGSSSSSSPVRHSSRGRNSSVTGDGGEHHHRSSKGKNKPDGTVVDLTVSSCTTSSLQYHSPSPATGETAATSTKIQATKRQGEEQKQQHQLQPSQSVATSSSNNNQINKRLERRSSSVASEALMASLKVKEQRLKRHRVSTAIDETQLASVQRSLLQKQKQQRQYQLKEQVNFHISHQIARVPSSSQYDNPRRPKQPKSVEVPKTSDDSNKKNQNSIERRRNSINSDAESSAVNSLISKESRKSNPPKMTKKGTVSGLSTASNDHTMSQQHKQQQQEKVRPQRHDDVDDKVVKVKQERIKKSDRRGSAASELTKQQQPRRSSATANKQERRTSTASDALFASLAAKEHRLKNRLSVISETQLASVQQSLLQKQQQQRQYQLKEQVNFQISHQIARVPSSSQYDPQPQNQFAFKIKTNQQEIFSAGSSATIPSPTKAMTCTTEEKESEMFSAAASQSSVDIVKYMESENSNNKRFDKIKRSLCNNSIVAPDVIQQKDKCIRNTDGYNVNDMNIGPCQNKDTNSTYKESRKGNEIKSEENSPVKSPSRVIRRNSSKSLSQIMQQASDEYPPNEAMPKIRKSSRSNNSPKSVKSTTSSLPEQRSIEKNGSAKDSHSEENSQSDRCTTPKRRSSKTMDKHQLATPPSRGSKGPVLPSVFGVSTPLKSAPAQVDRKDRNKKVQTFHLSSPAADFDSNATIVANPATTCQATRSDMNYNRSPTKSPVYVSMSDTPKGMVKKIIVKASPRRSTNLSMTPGSPAKSCTKKSFDQSENSDIDSQSALQSMQNQDMVENSNNIIETSIGSKNFATFQKRKEKFVLTKILHSSSLKYVLAKENDTATENLNASAPELKIQSEDIADEGNRPLIGILRDRTNVSREKSPYRVRFADHRPKSQQSSRESNYLKTKGAFGPKKPLRHDSFTEIDQFPDDIEHNVKRRNNGINENAVKIQTCYRGWKTRKLNKLLLMQYQIKCVEVKKQSELKAIQSEKWKAMESFGKKLERRFEKSHADSNLAEKLADILARDNEKVKGQNDLLRGCCQHLRENNDHLELTVQVHSKNYSVMKSTMDVVQEHNNMLSRRLKRLKEKIEAVQETINDTDQLADIERKGRNEIRETTSCILNTVQARCKDNRLVSYILALQEHLCHDDDSDEKRQNSFYNDSFDSHTNTSESLISLSSP